MKPSNKSLQPDALTHVAGLMRYASKGCCG
jgi:hypothetical protein